MVSFHTPICLRIIKIFKLPLLQVNCFDLPVLVALHIAFKMLSVQEVTVYYTRSAVVTWSATVRSQVICIIYLHLT